MAQPGGLFSFGATPQQPAPAFGAATGSVFGGGGGAFSMGQQPQQAAPAAAPAYSFGGAPAAAPATGSIFGAAPGQPAAAPPAFGTTGGSMFSFGSNQPTANPPAGTSAGFSFGAPTAAAPAQQPAGAFSFGAPPASAPPATGLSFGAAPAVAHPQTSGLTFGMAPGTTATPGLFGATPAAGTSGLSFGAPPASTAPAGGFSFGAPAAPATTGLAMGAAAPAQTAGLSFGAPPAASTGLTFGTPAAGSSTTATVAPFSFGTKLGATTTSAPSTAGTLGGFSFGAPSTGATTTTATAPATGFSFGQTPASASTMGASSLFGTTTTATTTTATPGFSFGTKLGAPAPTSTGLTFGGFGGLGMGQPAAAPAATTASVPSTGLGGVPKYASTGAENSFAFGGGTSDGKTENRALQELPLPQEMLLLVEELKNQIKSDKLKFTELNRSSNDAIITKVAEEIDEVRSQVTVIGNLIQKQANNCEAIRGLVHEGIADAEMANQTRETPLTSQADHTSPIQYFFRLVDKYRDRMHVYLREIEKAESSLSYVLSAQSSFTSKELLDACNVTRNSIIALAAKVQILHEEVVRVLEQHRNLQRYLLGEATDLSKTGPKQSVVFAKVLSQKDENRFGDHNVLFPHKIVEPPKIGSLHIAQNVTTGKTTTPPGGTLTSTPTRLPHQQQNLHNKSSDSLFYPSHALFQTQQSTILSPTHVPPSQSPTISLKRSKR